MKSKKTFRIVLLLSIILVGSIAIGLLYRRKTIPQITLQNTTKPVVINSNTALLSSKQYRLQNTTEKDQLERMLFVTLQENGKAILHVPSVSSYLLPECAYFIDDTQLQIHAIIPKGEETFYGLENGETVAIFKIQDENTLVFESASIPIFADAGAKYKSSEESYFSLDKSTIDEPQILYGYNLQ